jgi:hypothetical protein
LRICLCLLTIALKLEKLISKYIDFVRLRECVELLEDMKMKGLLDMTKVHASSWLFLPFLYFSFEFHLYAIFTGYRFIMPSFSTSARKKKLLKKLLIMLGLFQIQR